MKRFEVPGHALGTRCWIRSGCFTIDDLNQIRYIRDAVRLVFPQDKKTLRPIAYTLHVEETDIGFFLCRVETMTRSYIFSQPTLEELISDVGLNLAEMVRNFLPAGR